MKTAIMLAVTAIVIVAVAVLGYTVYAYYGTSPSGPAVQTTSVSMANFRFNPHTIEIQAGQTVTWTNDDSVSHTVVGFGENASVPAGGTFSHTFATPGTYDYACTIHPGMTGTVIVK